MKHRFIHLWIKQPGQVMTQLCTLEVMLDNVSVNNYPQFVEFTAVMSYV